LAQKAPDRLWANSNTFISDKMSNFVETSKNDGAVPYCRIRLAARHNGLAQALKPGQPRPRVGFRLVVAGWRLFLHWPG
jgi:hypothetical protein